MATGTEPTSGEQFVDTAVETSMSTAEVRVPRKWYYLTLAFLAWTGLYYVFVLSISLTAGGTGVWELAIVGLFIAHGPLAVFIYLDTRRVAAANRNPEVIERSRILGSWKRPLRIVVLLVALNYVLPLVVVALWYLVSTRPKALRAPEREPDVEGAEAAGEAEETQTGDPEEEIREKRDDERQEERRPEERNDKTEDEEKRERKDLPPLPPKRYQRARELKSTGEERAAAGDTL
ncbi:hypothetical protein, partial [Salinigranum sp.]|uniref:hypothetical protein n=1 Tax=Salinigranum sp. TaxID=1966351 RepID=UPI0035699B48